MYDLKSIHQLLLSYMYALNLLNYALWRIFRKLSSAVCM